MPRKPTLDDYINAILDRDSGTPYSDVLESYDITPNQFARAVNSSLGKYIVLTQDTTLKLIEENPERKKELFNMGEEFIKEQYDCIHGKNKTQKRFYEGTLSHPENINTIIYHALTSNNPDLASTDRKKVIEGIKALPTNLKCYLHSIGLNGLMVTAFESSPLAILKVFDKVYQRETGDKSLFDLSQEYHLHEWGDNFHASDSYWKKSANVEKAVYHILTENNADLTLNDRKKLIEGIKALPTNLQDYFHSIGLNGLMGNSFEKGEQGSPLAVLKVFDEVYQRETGDKSLFDLSQEYHLHEWGDNFHASRFYWQKPANVEKTVYHTLTEDNPDLASTDRKKVIEGIKALPTDLVHYFYSIGLNGLMGNSFEKGEQGSPLAVLKVFDKVYQRETGDKSLFDLNEAYHLNVSKGNRILK